MCGIIGKIGVGNIVPDLINGLKNLEYRGYDSAGIAILNENGLSRYRTVGQITNLQAELKNVKPESSIGIGHTRWATHGTPTVANAHPHMSPDGKFAVVHNGIIENAEELKKTFLASNSVFTSKTDTEVIAHLLGRFYKGDIISAISDACRELKGSFALGILCKDYPDRFFAVASASPLVAVKGKTGCYIASDLCAVKEENGEVYRLSSGEICSLSEDGICFFNAGGEKIDKYPENIKSDNTNMDKNGYEHYMLKEIFEQPDAVKNTLLSFIKSGEIVFPHIKTESSFFKNHLKKIVIVACGSAYHTGLIGKTVIESMCKIPVSVEIASEFRYSQPLVDENALAIFISQSGETADTLAALRLAKKYNAEILSVVNVKSSAISEESANVIYTEAGREIAVATTKAYSAQLVALYALSVYIADLRGTISAGLKKRYIDELLTLPEKIEKTLNTTADKMKELSAKIHKTNDIFYIGRLADFATASEGSLKMKEISYINSQAYAAGELKHGTISLISQGTPLIAIATDNKIFKKTVSNVAEVAARGAKVIFLTDALTDESETEADDFIKVPKTLPEFQSSLLVLPLQLLGYYTAKLLGRDIDKPKNLAKSVTVE